MADEKKGMSEEELNDHLYGANRLETPFGRFLDLIFEPDKYSESEQEMIMDEVINSKTPRMPSSHRKN